MSKTASISTVTLKIPTSSRKASTLSNKNYDNLNLGQRLTTENLDQLCRSKKETSEKEPPNEEEILKEKYAELVKQVKDLHEDFKTRCIPESIRSKIPRARATFEEDPLDVIKAIKGILDMLERTMKEQDKMSMQNFENRKGMDYELLLQMVESDIKRYIRNEQQMKYVIETMQAKVEECDKDRDNFLLNAKNLFKDAKTDNGKLIDLIRQKDAEIGNLNKINKQKEETIKSYEERLLSIPILEHKMSGLKERHAKEKEMVKQHYIQEFANLTKEIQHIHKTLTVNLNLDERIKLLEQELYAYKDFNIKKLGILEERIKGWDDLNEKFENEQGMEMNRQEELDISDSRPMPPKSTRIRNITSAASPRDPKMFQPHNNRNRSTPTIAERTAEDKTFIIKQKLNKKKVELCNEINALSIGRTKGLNQELISSTREAIRARSPVKFDDYFAYLQKKLDTLNQLNKEEKEYLRSFNTVHPESSHRDSKMVRFLNIEEIGNRKLEEQMHSLGLTSPKKRYSKVSASVASRDSSYR